MLKYRGSGLIKAGFIGVVLVIVVLVGLSPDRLISLGNRCQVPGAVFRGGWPGDGQPRDDIGIKVGSVSDVSLRQRRPLVTFR